MLSTTTGEVGVVYVTLREHRHDPVDHDVVHMKGDVVLGHEPRARVPLGVVEGVAQGGRRAKRGAKIAARPKNAAYRYEHLLHEEAAPGHHGIGPARQRLDDGGPLLRVDVRWWYPAGRDVVAREQVARPQQQPIPIVPKPTSRNMPSTALGHLCSTRS
jgi:hypothetical protein